MAGQIIVVSGTTGAGKTTTCSNFVRRAEEPYLLMGMDLLVGSMFPSKYTIFGEKSLEGYAGTSFGPMAMRAVSAMHEMVAAASRAGQNMMFEHSMFLDPPLLQDCVWRLRDLPVLFVNLRPSRDVLLKRINERQFVLPAPIVETLGGEDGMKKLAERITAMSPWFYDHVYANDCYDLELNSSELSPDEVCERIEARLAEGPGTAFEVLRQRHPRPVRD